MAPLILLRVTSSTIFETNKELQFTKIKSSLSCCLCVALRWMVVSNMLMWMVEINMLVSIMLMWMVVSKMLVSNMLMWMVGSNMRQLRAPLF